jgi:molybdenum cofactor biosynthesis MoaF-like protein
VAPHLLQTRDDAQIKEASMESDRVRGKTIRWTYEDGPMAGKRLEHTFGADGTVSWRETDGEEKNTKQQTGKPATEPKAKYQVAPVNDDVCVVSYLSASGYTLTSILDFASGTIVSFASNEKELVLQRGVFEETARV